MPCKIMKKNCVVVNPTKSKQNLRVFWKLMNLREYRMGNSMPHFHQDHIARNGVNSLQHYNLVHKFIPMPQAMKIPAAKAAVDKEWEKMEKISAWNLTKVKSKKSDNLMTHFRMPVKRQTIFGPCREASYTAITSNPESNFTRREKNHSLFH